MKKRTLAGVLSLLLCITMIGVGFAAWVITDDAGETANGNIDVDKVVDKRLSISSSNDNAETTDIEFLTKTSIVFGAPASPTNDGWLKATEYEGEAAKVENLSTNLNFTIGNFAMCSKVEVTLTYSNETTVNSAVTNKYITIPTASYVYTKATGDTDTITFDGNGNASISFEFGWGEAFGETNPYTYFNTKGVNDKLPDSEKTYGDVALESLEALEALKDVTFTITIKAFVDAE